MYVAKFMLLRNNSLSLDIGKFYSARAVYISIQFKEKILQHWNIFYCNCSAFVWFAWWRCSLRMTQLEPAALLATLLLSSCGLVCFVGIVKLRHVHFCTTPMLAILFCIIHFCLFLFYFMPLTFRITLINFHLTNFVSRRFYASSGFGTKVKSCCGDELCWLFDAVVHRTILLDTGVIDCFHAQNTGCCNRFMLVGTTTLWLLHQCTCCVLETWLFVVQINKGIKSSIINNETCFNCFSSHSSSITKFVGKITRI